jgi:putative membrane protein
VSGVPGQVFDAGLQAERTALAWRRTALALGVGAVGAGRLAAPVIGVVAVALAGLGLVQAVAVAAAAQRRYRATHRSLIERSDLSGVRTAGLPIAALALTAATVGVLALAFVLGPTG